MASRPHLALDLHVIDDSSTSPLATQRPSPALQMANAQLVAPPKDSDATPPHSPSDTSLTLSPLTNLDKPPRNPPPNLTRAPDNHAPVNVLKPNQTAEEETGVPHPTHPTHFDIMNLKTWRPATPKNFYKVRHALLALTPSNPCPSFSCPNVVQTLHGIRRSGGSKPRRFKQPKLASDPQTIKHEEPQIHANVTIFHKLQPCLPSGQPNNRRSPPTLDPQPTPKPTRAPKGGAQSRDAASHSQVVTST
ncbi:hypothetical protein DFP72DRAFT_843349 [Ephemerocybe angulata]|uniref:Uncharacterized protein n=1 Tax=Ephemerocybe angulata TaxID=980116 RepID=A0A8H6I9M6_9AGAR|nr:hypothetical protein DFP72DRAFT_843349 [Tulosesus angulatus]